MKINVSVDLDWLEEDGSIDELVQSELISGVKKSISKDCLSRVQDKASQAIDNAIESAIAKAEELVDKKVSEFVDEWLSNEVVVSDRYGDTVQKGSLKEVVKQQFDKMMNSMVDSNGKLVSGNGYGAKCSVVRFLTGEAVKEVVGSELSNYKRDIDKKIKEEINNGIKNNVSDLFAQMVVNTAKENYRDAQAIEQKPS